MARSLALLLGVLFAPAGWALPPYAEEPVATPVPEADPFTWEFAPAVVHAGTPGRLTARLVVPDGYVVYQDQVEVRVLDTGPLVVGPADLPPARVEPDPVDGTDLRPQYPVDVVIYLPVEAPAAVRGGVVVKLETRHQGCRRGLCFSPALLTHEVLVVVRPQPLDHTPAR